MAYYCVKGMGECSGCMACTEPEEGLTCARCGYRLLDEDLVYVMEETGEVAGCSFCLRTLPASLL